jgi:hypothetical protein
MVEKNVLEEAAKRINFVFYNYSLNQQEKLVLLETIKFQLMIEEYNRSRD